MTGMQPLQLWHGRRLSSWGAGDIWVSAATASPGWWSWASCGNWVIPGYISAITLAGQECSVTFPNHSGVDLG